MKWSKNFSATWLFSFGFLILTGCSFKQDKMQSEPANALETVTSFSGIQTQIFQPKCLHCHSGPSAGGGVDLTSYNSIMSNPGLITPNQPPGSRIFTEVESGGMPQGGPPLSASEIKVIENWILAGAPDGSFALGAKIPQAPPVAAPPTASNPAVPAPPTPAPTPTPDPAVNPKVTFQDVQSKIFATSCVRCHSGPKPSGQIDLSSYTKIMENGKAIVPGFPQQSLAYTEIESGSMPPRGALVNPQLIQMLNTWITEGAKND